MATSASLSADGTPSDSNGGGGGGLAAAAGATGASVRSSTFDYLYEFSETRKVLEEFFKCPSTDDRVLDGGSDVDSIVSTIYLPYPYYL